MIASLQFSLNFSTFLARIAEYTQTTYMMSMKLACTHVRLFFVFCFLFFMKIRFLDCERQPWVQTSLSEARANSRVRGSAVLA